MHTQGQAIDFLEKCWGPAKLSNAGLNANVLCPICHEKTGETEKKKLAIRTDSWLTKCWICNYKSKTIYGLLKRYKPHQADEFIKTFNAASLISDAEEAAFKAQEEAIELPRGFQLLAEYYDDPEAPYYIRQAVKYLKQRGVTYRDFWYFKLGITALDLNYKNRILIPSHDQEGNLNFFTSRTHRPSVKPKYFNPRFHRETVIINEINIDWSEELTIVEGPFDLFKVNDNATCLLGKELTKEYALFQKIATNKTPVLLCLDNDAKRASLDIAKSLYDYDVNVRILILPEEIKDPGEMKRDKFIDLINDGKHIVEFDDLYYLRNLML